MDIWEDREDENREEISAVVDDDVDPPERSDRPPLGGLAINLLGVNYGGDGSYDDEFDDDEAGAGSGGVRGENQKMYEENETIGGQFLEDVNDQNTNQGTNASLEDIPPIETPQASDAAPTGTSGPSAPAPPSAGCTLPSPEIVADGRSTRDIVVDDFHLAMMIFVSTADLSISQYEALTEVLALATLESIMRLPKSITTLKERCRKSFPLLNIKARPVDISLNVTPPKSESPRRAYYFNTSEYCRLWLSNPNLSPLIHQGFGEIVESPTELWHGDAWMESVRSTSGQFAKIQDDILLPSDCVRFIDTQGAAAYGRVKAIGLDKRDKRHEKGVLSAVISRLVPRDQLPTDIRGALEQPDQLPQSPEAKRVEELMYPSFPSSLPELVLFESREIVPCSAIYSRIWVYFTDYESPESLGKSLLPYPPSFCVRHIVYMPTTTGKPVCSVRKVARRHRITAEGELIHLTRDYVLSSLVAKSDDERTSGR